MSFFWSITALLIQEIRSELDVWLFAGGGCRSWSRNHKVATISMGLVPLPRRCMRSLRARPPWRWRRQSNSSANRSATSCLHSASRCAWRQSKQQTQQQHRNSNARKTEQLNRKGEREYKKINELARAKLQQIQVARKQQVQEKLQQIMITAMRSRGEAGTEEQNGRNRSKKSLIALKMS